ncbi:NTE family protein [Reichenbachiella faecimaris]|uniref:NTE family protein n=1 Tax=Reichenbachiella faecimaris TaxID=692418 RepID=A0A1W2G715_REIFA|nr:patatin-like phospholipase family protein [Reichenbachiella faecimaris]SMD32457.1 NTE family protein [Reichenbachiella faecimaris]
MIKKANPERQTVSLVLGSGGARGLAHIGVIKWLTENNYDIKSIAGCSIGAMIGGVHAAGKLDELEEWMCSITKMDMANLLDISWGNGGIFKGDKVIDTLKDLLGDVQIENLSIPFTAVAADMITQKEVWINKGSLFDAIRASISLPLFFTPVKRKDKLLIDGGVLNPVPIAPTFNDQTDFTIAVNLGGPLLKKNEKEPEVEEQKEGWGKFQQNIKDFIAKYSNSDDTKKKDWSIYEVADRAFDTMQSSIARMKITTYPPDVEIKIARNTCGTLDFDRAEQMIHIGFERAKEAFDAKNKVV